MFYVKGGVFESTKFENVCKGLEECYGPFKTYEEAMKEWKRRTFTQSLDICTHRMKIEEVKKSEPVYHEPIQPRTYREEQTAWRNAGFDAYNCDNVDEFPTWGGG